VGIGVEKGVGVPAIGRHARNRVAACSQQLPVGVGVGCAGESATEADHGDRFGAQSLLVVEFGTKPTNLVERFAEQRAVIGGFVRPVHTGRVLEGWFGRSERRRPARNSAASCSASEAAESGAGAEAGEASDGESASKWGMGNGEWGMSVAAGVDGAAAAAG